MTFNHVKSSHAFTKKTPMFDVSVLHEDDEFNKWLGSTGSSKQDVAKIIARKSEDGWSKKKRGGLFSASNRQQTMGAKSFGGNNMNSS